MLRHLTPPRITLNSAEILSHFYWHRGLRHGNKNSIKDTIADEIPPSVNDDKSPTPNTIPAPKEPLSYAERRQMMIDFGKELSKVPGIRIQTEEELREENRYYRFYGDPDSDYGKK
jgi:hypothetical protein